MIESFFERVMVALSLNKPGILILVFSKTPDAITIIEGQFKLLSFSWLLAVAFFVVLSVTVLGLRKTGSGLCN